MLRPIPNAILTDTAVVKVCTGLDVWQNPSEVEYTVKNVHLQSTNEVKKSSDNTEVVLRSILFVDSRKSKPVLQYDALAAQSQKAGKPLRCIVYDATGIKRGDFEVLTVDTVPDVPATRTHHTELGLV